MVSATAGGSNARQAEVTNGTGRNLEAVTSHEDRLKALIDEVQHPTFVHARFVPGLLNLRLGTPRMLMLRLSTASLELSTALCARKVVSCLQPHNVSSGCVT